MRPLVIGLGRSGGQILNWFLERVWDDVAPETLAVDVTEHHLDGLHNKETLLLGRDNPAADLKTLPTNVARMIVQDEMDRLRPYLGDHDPLWIVTGLGGSFGTEAALAIAGEAQKAGRKTFAAVSFPFDFEPDKRLEKAEGARDKLQLYTDETFCLRLQLIMNYLQQEEIEKWKVFKHANQVMSNLLYFLMTPMLRGSQTDLEALERLSNLSFMQKRNLLMNAFAPGWRKDWNDSPVAGECFDDSRPFWERIQKKETE
ncbi:MAG: hypothetical protein ABEK50_00390 [bacterium]